MVPNAIENQVIALPTFSEILLGVIDDVIRTDRSNHVHVRCTADAGNLSAKCLGDLHSEGADTSGRAVNHHLPSRLNSSLVAKTLQGCECREGYRSCVLERDIVRLHDQPRRGRAHVLSESPLADPGFYARSMRIPDTDAEHFVAWFEPRDVRADCFNLARHVNA